MTRLLVLLLALAGAARADEPAPVTSAAAPGDDEAAAPRRLLLAPFASPRNSYFYSGLGLPRLREADGGREGELTARLRVSETHTADTRDVDGRRSRIDGLYIEHARVDLALAVQDRLTLTADLRVAGWDERRDVFRLFDDTGQLTIERERNKAAFGFATKRHENLAVVTFGALVTWWRGDDGVSAFGTGLELKLPGFRRADITNTGTTDVALTAHLSLGLGERLAVHWNGGVVVPLGRPWIFEDPTLEDPRPLGQTALGLTVKVADWAALGASLEAETSPWDHHVRVLDRPALTGSVGARLLLGRFTVELGVGCGASAGSADWLAWVELGYASRRLWTP